MQKDRNFLGYPAIVDEGDAVGVRILDTQCKAEQQHQSGLLRLYRLQLRKECTYILKIMPQSPALELIYQKLPNHPIIHSIPTVSLKEDLLNCILNHVFIEGRRIRTREWFERNMQECKPTLMTIVNDVGKTALAIMESYQKIMVRLKPLKANDPLAADVRKQLNFMIYAGFIRHTPFDQLKAIPRYLKAIEYRLDKLNNDPVKLQEITRFTTRFWQDMEKKSKKETVIPERDPFRWALEEFRVSLFAQQLKTAYPVSAKRLEKAWDERG